MHPEGLIEIKGAKKRYWLVFSLLIVELVLIGYMGFKLNQTEKEFNLEINKLNNSLNDYVKSQIASERASTQQGFMEVSKRISEVSQAQESTSKELNLIKSDKGDFSGIVEEAVKGVVSIGTDKASGSGFFVSSDGYIVTNEHVISGASRIAVMTYNQNVMSAKLVGFSKTKDVALLKVSGTEYHKLVFGDSDELQIGKKVVAIGNPLGLSFSVTEGIISALNREGPNGLEEYIQTDVSLNPGNSGGPLIDNQGRVIGVNNFKIGDAESLGFALESKSAVKAINQIANATLV